MLHLFYVANLKLVGKQEEELQKRVQTAKILVVTATWHSELIVAP
jgi:hypothetical protein